MNDLLLTDKDRLKDWLKTKKYVKTSDIIRFGSLNFSNRANRNKQELVQQGFLRRLSEDEKLRSFGLMKEDVYEVIA